MISWITKPGQVETEPLNQAKILSAVRHSPQIKIGKIFHRHSLKVFTYCSLMNFKFARLRLTKMQRQIKVAVVTTEPTIMRLIAYQSNVYLPCSLARSTSAIKIPGILFLLIIYLIN